MVKALFALNSIHFSALVKRSRHETPWWATSPLWPLDAPVRGRRWARAADGRVRARGPRPLRMRRRAIEAERDPVPHAAVDSQTRSAQTVAARQRRRSVLSPRALCFLTQTRATYEEESWVSRRAAPRDAALPDGALPGGNCRSAFPSRTIESLNPRVRRCGLAWFTRSTTGRTR